MTAEIGEQIVDAEVHVADPPFLHDFAVHVGQNRRGARIDAANQAGADRAEAVHALDARHAAGVGVAEVLRADVVRRCEAGDVLPHVVRPHALHR